ncbi:MAG: hypothetical protein AAFR88_11825, partial [Pseudomonadota bacterium]
MDVAETPPHLTTGPSVTEPSADPRSAARAMPRWWRRFVVVSRRANLFLWLEIFAVIALGLAIWANAIAYSREAGPGEVLPAMQVSLLLLAVLVPAMAILVLGGRRL